MTNSKPNPNSTTIVAYLAFFLALLVLYASTQPRPCPLADAQLALDTNQNQAIIGLTRNCESILDIVKTMNTTQETTTRIVAAHTRMIAKLAKGR